MTVPRGLNVSSSWLARRDGSHYAMPAESFFENPIRSPPTDPGNLRRDQQGDPFLSKVESNLSREELPATRIHDNYLPDDTDLSWCAPLGKSPVLAIHQFLISDLTSCIHAMHAHLGVAAMLALLGECFQWAFMTRDVSGYIIPCGCRRRPRART